MRLGGLTVWTLALLISPACLDAQIFFLLYQRAQALAHQRVIIDDEDGFGSDTSNH